MNVVVTGGSIRVDGIQFGPTYSSHQLAVNIGKQVKEKHYPHANFVDIPELKPFMSNQSPKQKRTKTCLMPSH